MEKPLVHRNGTAADSLLEQYTTAMTALQKAIRSLEETSPNGRDYYPLGEASFRAARREHEERMRRLSSVLAELHELAEHVAEST